jgi:hypothetical protein
MKKSNLFFVIIFVIFSLVVNAQSKIGARAYTQAKYDSVLAELKAMDDGATVDIKTLRKAMTVVHDMILKDGHREYMSLNGTASKKITAKIDSVKNSINDVALYTTNVEKALANVETVIAGDETPVTTNEVKIETTTKSASEIAMEAIKKAVAARRAAAEKDK